MLSESEKKRLTRLKNKADIKRSDCVDRIRSIHKLAVWSRDDPEEIPRFLILADGLDEIWSAFVKENDAFLDCLTELDQISDYDIALVGNMHELIASSKEIANSHREQSLQLS